MWDNNFMHIVPPKHINMFMIRNLDAKFSLPPRTRTRTRSNSGLTPWYVVCRGNSASITSISTKLSLSPYSKKIGVTIFRVGNYGPARLAYLPAE